MSSHAYVSRMVRYRPLGNTGDMAAVITQVHDDKTVDLTVFAPSAKNLTTFTNIKYAARASEADAKPGTCYP